MSENDSAMVNTASGLSPDEAFKILGNDVRIDILRALWQAFTPYDDQPPVTFNELYHAVDVGDTGQFNYHLGKLTDWFVTHTDDGYELTHAGLALIQTVIAGTALDDPTLPPTEIDVPCPFCDEAVVVTYEDEIAQFSCTACDGAWESGSLGAMPFPPAGVGDRTPSELHDAAFVWYWHRFESLLDGVCPQCAGTVEHEIDVCADHDVANARRCEACKRLYGYVFTLLCPTCKHAHRAPFRAAVLSHQAVASFYDDHGIDYRYPSFDAFRRASAYREELISEEPLRVRITVPTDTRELRLTLDGELTVVDATRARSTGK